MRVEVHRWRTVGPEPDGVRGLPFALAHIEMVVARRAPPIDGMRRLAVEEAAVLPEILARAGAAAAVQTVNERRGDAARFEDEARHARGKLLARADRGADRLVLGVAASGLGHLSIRRAPSAA